MFCNCIDSWSLPSFLFPSTNSQQQDIMDAPSLQKLASHWLYHSAKEGQIGCQSNKDCWTDHRLFVNKLNLHIQPVRRPQGKKLSKRLDISNLKQDNKRQAFINDICSRLNALEHSSEDVNENWSLQRHRSLFSNRYQAPTHWFKFYEEVVIESEARTAVVQSKREA